MRNNFLIRPGTLLLIIITGVALLGMFTWFSDDFARTKNRSIQQQDQALKCSSLNVDFLDRSNNSTHQIVYFQTNRDVASLMIRFRGKGNYSKIVKNVERNSITRVAAPIESYSTVEARAEGCERVLG